MCGGGGICADKHIFYQNYSTNWYINGKVFTSTTAWEPKTLILFKKKHAYLSVSAVMFCKQFLAFTVHIN